jgi:nitroreductase
MDLVEAIEGRRSVRTFRAGRLPEGFLEEAVRLGNLAPSAGNLQARDFIIVKDRKRKRLLAQAALDQQFIADASAVIVICANEQRIFHYGKRGRELYMLQDAAAAATHILLYAYSRGIGSCWVGAFEEDAVSRLLGLPAQIRPVAMLPVGAAAEAPPARQRLPVAEIMHDEKW